ncbi:MAG: response regulator [Flavobacteriales bacterium]|nr:response regulator [Flavobacteriales bacterium]MCC6938503.1 response regulator [Flavobacteriales bacterium]
MNALARDLQPVELPTVLFVDDDAGNRQAFHAAFRHQMNVLLAADLSEAWEHLGSKTVHVVIADQRMPRTTGSELLTMVKERHPTVRRMLVTAYSDLEAIIDAVNNGGVTKYFAKPWVSDQLVKAVQEAYVEITNEAERANYLTRLEESNRQLEFALRQRLLS